MSLLSKKVRKIGGSFEHTGTVVSEFKTTAGEDRIVLEFDPPTNGMLHIYRPDQVEVEKTTNDVGSKFLEFALQLAKRSECLGVLSCNGPAHNEVPGSRRHIARSLLRMFKNETGHLKDLK